MVRGFVSQAGIAFEDEALSTWECDVGRIMQAAPAFDIEIVGPSPPLPDAR